MMILARDWSEKSEIERNFYNKMREKYGENVAGELLSMLWNATKERSNE